MQKDDQVRLRHMLDAALEARAFTKSRNRTSLDMDRMLVLSLVKEIEIISEDKNSQPRAHLIPHPNELLNLVQIS